MERHRIDAPACGLVDLLLTIQAPIVGIAGGPSVLLAGRDLLVIQIECRAIAPRDLHGFLSTKDKLAGYAFSRIRMWKTAATAISALCAAPRHARVLPLTSSRHASRFLLFCQQSCIILWGQLRSGVDKVLPVPVPFKDKAVSLVGLPAQAPVTRCQRSQSTRMRHVRPCARHQGVGRTEHLASSTIQESEQTLARGSIQASDLLVHHLFYALF